MQNQKSTKKSEYYSLENDLVAIKPTYDVNLTETFVLTTETGPIYLEVNIVANLLKIPEEYHEVFLNMLTSKYLNKASFGDNPFSKCKPYKKRRWWQFWKPKYSMHD